jgi:hypothetical protein
LARPGLDVLLMDEHARADQSGGNDRRHGAETAGSEGDVRLEALRERAGGRGLVRLGNGSLRFWRSQ